VVDTDIYSSSCAILSISLRPCLLFSHHAFLFVVASTPASVLSLQLISVLSYVAPTIFSCVLIIFSFLNPSTTELFLNDLEVGY
jgi:hypothetical protein